MQIPLFKNPMTSKKELKKIEEVFDESSSFFAKTDDPVRPV
jgi:hypothetical protein